MICGTLGSGSLSLSLSPRVWPRRRSRKFIQKNHFAIFSDAQDARGRRELRDVKISAFLRTTFGGIKIIPKTSQKRKTQIRNCDAPRGGVRQSGGPNLENQTPSKILQKSRKTLPKSSENPCLLGHAFAWQSVEFILNLNSSWLYCLLLLTFACLCLLRLLWLLALSVPLLLRFSALRKATATLLRYAVQVTRLR